VNIFIAGNKPEILIAQFAAKAIQWRLQRNMEALSQKRPIISPIADPVVIPELINTPIDINFPEIISFVGHIKIEYWKSSELKIIQPINYINTKF